MSSYLNYDENGNYIKEIESYDICKYKINEICCNDKSERLGDYPSPFCKCESKEDCEWFEKEDEE